MTTPDENQAQIATATRNLQQAAIDFMAAIARAHPLPTEASSAAVMFSVPSLPVEVMVCVTTDRAIQQTIHAQIFTVPTRVN